MCEYKILNYWNDSDDLYVDYIVINKDEDKKAHCIEYFNTSDINCDYNSSSSSLIEENLLKLLTEHNGFEFNMPKISEASELLKYVYDFVCESESNMCHIDDNDWNELKEEYNFTDEDIKSLVEEINNFHLEDLLTIDENGYKICGYGILQTMFNDDRERTDVLER